MVGHRGMNIHHLELFYHVARCRGVSAAARQMPYGIQQPAISAQILQLEDSLGQALFHRRPFALTPAGAELLEFITPFFGGLPAMAARLRGGADTSLRVACPEVVQRDYLPGVIEGVRARVPGFHFSLECGRSDEILQLLRTGRIDIGLTTTSGPADAAIRYEELLQMALVLVVPEAGGFTRADDILTLDRIDLPLITLPRVEPVVRMFQQELVQRKIEWFPKLELASLDLIERFVAAGHGAGLLLDRPAAARLPGLRYLPLEGFPRISFQALTPPQRNVMTECFIEEARKVIDSW